MEKTEELYARLFYEIRLYKNQLALLQKEIEKLTLTSLDASNASHTVESIEHGDVLVPIGSGSFVKGIITSKNVLLGIGAGYVIEVDNETAAGTIRKREAAARDAINKLSQEYSAIAAKLEGARRQLQEIEMQIIRRQRGEESMREDYV